MAGMELNIKVWLKDAKLEGIDVMDIDWLNRKFEEYGGIEGHIEYVLGYQWIVEDVVVEVEGGN